MIVNLGVALLAEGSESFAGVPFERAAERDVRIVFQAPGKVEHGDVVGLEQGRLQCDDLRWSPCRGRRCSSRPVPDCPILDILDVRRPNQPRRANLE